MVCEVVGEVGNVKMRPALFICEGSRQTGTTVSIFRPFHTRQTDKQAVWQDL